MWIFKFFIKIELIYNGVLVSDIQQSDSVLYVSVCVYVYIYAFLDSFPF